MDMLPCRNPNALIVFCHMCVLPSLDASPSVAPSGTRAVVYIRYDAYCVICCRVRQPTQPQLKVKPQLQ